MTGGFDMTKLLLIPSSASQIDETLDLSDGYILSVKGLSVNSPFYMNMHSLNEIIIKLKEKEKQVFISLNKNISNCDLKVLKETLLELNKMDIDGVLYYDVSVLSLVQKLSLSLPLIWSQEHMTTNYLTCNYYEEKKVKGVYLSSEITLEEIKQIRKKTSLKIIVPIFGYLPMFNSKRHIVQNYLDTFNIKDDSKIYYMEKENKKYPLIDDENGTTVYSSHILNGFPEYLDLSDIDYVTLNSFNIDNNQFIEVLKCFREAHKTNTEKLSQKIELMLPNLDKGFLYKETIYKVKK